MSHGRSSALLLRALRNAARSWTCQASIPALEPTAASLAARAVASSTFPVHGRSLHTSLSTRDEKSGVPTPIEKAKDVTKPEVPEYLLDKDVWDEVWAYEPRFGTEDKPIIVPSSEPERIIGVTDPDDDTLVIWGIIREGDPPRQLVTGGEFFVLKQVEKVERVGDVLGIEY